jgi:hypothetical protein
MCRSVSADRGGLPAGSVRAGQAFFRVLALARQFAPLPCKLCKVSAHSVATGHCGHVLAIPSPLKVVLCLGAHAERLSAAASAPGSQRLPPRRRSIAPIEQGSATTRRRGAIKAGSVISRTERWDAEDICHGPSARASGRARTQRGRASQNPPSRDRHHIRLRRPPLSLRRSGCGTHLRIDASTTSAVRDRITPRRPTCNRKHSASPSPLP